MASPEFEALLAAADRTQKMLWAVLTLAIVLYGVVAYVAVPKAPDPALADTLRPILFVVAAGLAATSLVVFRRRKAQHIPGSTVSPEAGAQPNALLRARTEKLPPAERHALAEMARSFPTWLVCLVLNETIALLGLVLAFLAGGPDEVVPFAALAILLNLMMRPDARRRAATALGHVGL